MAHDGVERPLDPLSADSRLEAEFECAVGGHAERALGRPAASSGRDLGREAWKGQPDGAAVVGLLHQARGCRFGALRDGCGQGSTHGQQGHAEGGGDPVGQGGDKRHDTSRGNGRVGEANEWRRRLQAKGRAARAITPKFVPLHVKPERASAVAFQVELDSGARIHVPGGFDESELRRLVEVLSSC